MNDIQDRIIAGGVIACTVVLGFVLLSAVGDYHVKGDRRELTIDFDRVDNIKPNVTEIKLAGLPVGKVTGIRILAPGERIELRKSALERDPAATNAAPPTIRVEGYVDAAISLSAKTAVSIRQASMMSEHFIELSPGPPDSERLPEGAILAGSSGKSMDDLMDPGAALLANLRDATANVKTITTGLTSKIPEVVAKLDDILGHAKSLTADLTTEESRQKLRDTIANLKVITDNLKVATTHAKLITATLAQRPWRVVFGGKPNDLPDEDRIIDSDEAVPVKTAEPVDKPTHTKSVKVKPVEGGR